ncbi:rCG50625, isoform CRA_b [Rattus norvegicus]|uniref:RCG50625, isoform CRA_b n=1 Tax=Rattus norvegicus TaxID=10116 RepID=A6KCN6_RAT|nr:rCG50625, isoform CRA_b [Rattus norvegicus]
MPRDLGAGRGLVFWKRRVCGPSPPACDSSQRGKGCPRMGLGTQDSRQRLLIQQLAARERAA